jgi:2',3'-cyclic-nucleotide 2'-phosphodiesterase (5'-nucleotidase family)
MKHFGKLLIILFLCLSLVSCEKKELKDDIYIFFTSDVHCGVDEGMGLDGLKALVDETKSGHDYVTLVDLGDFVQSNALIDYVRSPDSLEGKYTGIEGRIIVE